MKFKYTILYVQNVAASLDFYERAFGFKRRMLHEGGDYGELDTGSTTLSFSSLALMRQLGKTVAGPGEKRASFEVAFETDVVAAAFARAVAAGGKAIQPVREESWGQTTSYVADPDGFLIEICSPVRPQP
jgi:lactoylglutathione lyase